MPRLLLPLVFALLLSRTPTRAAESDPGPQGDAVLPLLELLTAEKPAGAANAAARELFSRRSLVEALATSTKPAPTDTAERHPPIAALQSLGDYLAHHPAAFAPKLPSLEGFGAPQRLGQLFTGLIPHGLQPIELSARLAALDPLLDDSWVEAAAACGALDFHHLIRAQRGQLHAMLLAYQRSDDGPGILRLGEAIGRHSSPAAGIRPAELTEETLALFLAGGFGMQHGSNAEAFTLAKLARECRVVHPGLRQRLSDLGHSGDGLALLEIINAWEDGRREQALDLLLSGKSRDEWYVASLVHFLLLPAQIPENELALLARRLPDGVLAIATRIALDDKGGDQDECARLAMLLMPAFHARGVPKTDHRISLSLHQARETALRWWLAGRTDDAFRFLQEAFLNATTSDNEDELLHLAALARILGKDSALWDELQRRSKEWNLPVSPLQSAVLLAVAGKSREALDALESQPPRQLFLRLLADEEEWERLRQIAFQPEGPFREASQRLSHVIAMNRDPASAREYFSALPDKAKKETVLLLLLSGNDALCREQARDLILSYHAWSSMPFPLGLDSFGLWEEAIGRDLDHGKLPLFETVQNYTLHLGLTRDKPKTLGILKRLAAIDTLRSARGNFTPSGGSRAWDHRITVAKGLIDCGAVEEGCALLTRMLESTIPGRSLSDRQRTELRADFIPRRFSPFGPAEFVKIAALEFPAATETERLVFLAQTLGGQPVAKACEQMIALLEKHRASLTVADASRLLQSLSAALWGEPEQPRLREEAKRVFDLYQPDEAQRRFFKGWAGPPARKARFFNQLSLEQKPGSLHDPKAAGFRVLDGMGEIRRLLGQNESARAASLFREMQIRVLLDELPDERLSIVSLNNQGTFRSGFDGSPECVPLVAAECWDLDAPFFKDHVLLAWRCGWDEGQWHLARALSRYRFDRSASLAAARLARGGRQDDLRELLLLAEFDGVAHARGGRAEAALDRLQVCLNLSTFDPTPGRRILDALEAEGNSVAHQRGIDRIRGYWQGRLAEYPESPEIREAAGYWFAATQPAPER